jgi:hypothetical protein
MTTPSGPGPGQPDPGLAAVIGERRQLINLAYRLLGSLAEAEDAVQETYARWYSLTLRQRDSISSPGARLTTVTSRMHGLTCDTLVGARVVLADGRVVDCDTDREPELFWALRGAGGGRFGVVTSLVFATVPEPRATRFDLRWPDAAAAMVVAGWQDWAPDAPDDVTANLTIVLMTGVSLDGLVARPGQVGQVAVGAIVGHGRIRAEHGEERAAVPVVDRRDQGPDRGLGHVVVSHRSSRHRRRFAPVHDALLSGQIIRFRSCLITS